MGRKLSTLVLCLLFPLLVGYSALMMMGGSDTVVETEADYADYRTSLVDGQSWFGGDNLGSDLFDADAGVFTTGTYAWTIYASNTIANVGNALVITWVDDVGGAHLEWSDAEDLSADLVVGTLYKVKFDASINTGSATIHIYNQAGSSIDSISVSLSTLQTFTIYFVATHVTGDYMRMLGMGTGEEITIDNITLQAVTSPADYADTAAFIRVCSSGGTDAVNCATGYIGEVGSGETLSETVTNGNMESDSDWPNTGTPTTNERSGVRKIEGTYSRHIVVDEAWSGADQDISGSITLVTKSYRYSFWYYLEFGALYARVGPGDAFPSSAVRISSPIGAWKNRVRYGNLPSNNQGVIRLSDSSTGSEFYIDLIAFEEVTEPNLNSVMIYKEPQLAQEGWLTIGASFDPNDINTFTISQ